MPVDPLLVVRLLFRSKADFDSLPHVVDAVSVFLDTSVELPLERASKLGSLPLLNRIWDSLETLADHSSWSVRRLLLQEEESYMERQFWLSLTEACKNNDLSMVKWIFEHFPERGVCMQVVEEAAAAGAMDILQYFADNERDSEVDTRLVKRDIFFGGKDTANAAVAPSLEIEFSRERKKHTAETMTEMMFGTAPRRHGIECTTEAMDGAAENNHLEVVKWLHENRAEGCTTSAMDRAARSGHIEMVQWLHARRTEGCTKTAMDAAAGFGHLDIVKWLHDHSSVGCTALAMDAAAAMGHLDVVKWLHDNRSEGCTNDAMDFAAEGGHLNVVQWLHEHRSEGCTEAAMDLAAEGGKLDVVKFLHRHRSEGCTQDAMIGAAAGDHVRVMEWLHANRPGDCSAVAIDNAALHGAFEATMFLYMVRHERMSQEVTSNSKVRDYPGFYDFIFEKVWGHE